MLVQTLTIEIIKYDWWRKYRVLKQTEDLNKYNRNCANKQIYSLYQQNIH